MAQDVNPIIDQLRRARGPGRKPRKQALTVRYSPEMVAYFKATGQGWRGRMNAALKEQLC